MNMRTRRFAAAVVGLLGLLAATSPAGATPGPSLHGSGSVTLPVGFDDATGDSVRFVVNARGHGDQATGTFTVVHLDDAGGLYAHLVGEVTCLSVVNGVAVTTGIVQRAWFRDFPGWDITGTAAAITLPMEASLTCSGSTSSSLCTPSPRAAGWSPLWSSRRATSRFADGERE